MHVLVRTGEQARTQEGLTLAVADARRRVVADHRFRLIAALAGLVTLVFLLAGSGLPADQSIQILLLTLCLASLLAIYARSRAIAAELHAARVRAIDAGDIERQRIQRDLHDSAQQRFVSVRIHLGLLAERMQQANQRAAIEQLSRDIDAGLSEIRSVTLTGSPPRLVQLGVVEGLRSVVAHAPLKVSLESRGFGRYSPVIERNVYFACLEALQNVEKHAGRGAAVRVRLVGDERHVTFEVEDSGVGFDPDRVENGDGLVNLADRVGALHGHLVIDSRPGMGTRVRGQIPVA